MKILPRFLCLLLMLGLVFSQASCTKEKSEALKVAAQTFSSDANDAVKKVRELFLADVSSPEESVSDQEAKVAADINSLGTGKLNAELLSEMVKGPTPANPASDAVNKQFELLGRAYGSFASMYESLPKGYLFAKDAVKNSEKYSINLTVQLVNIANGIKAHPFTFRGRRILLIDKINRARQITDQNQRDATLAPLIEQVVQLRLDEKKANDEAILLCLKAAESGKRISELIRDYDKLSLGDILSLTSDALGFVSQISNNNPDIEGLLKKYTGIRDTIKNDPYWSPMLDKEIIGSGGNK